MKTLFVRLDRLGDLLVTLPADQMESLRDDDISWAIPQGLGSLVARSVPQRKFREFPRAFSWAAFRAFADFARGFERAVVFQAPWWVGLALLCAGVPVRVGVLSQWHSFLFFNRGVRQRRSRAEFHEQRYGLKLAAEGLGVSEPSFVPYLKLAPPAFSTVSGKFGIEEKKYVVVHPGMGGSAKNWSVEKYGELLKTLASRGIPVVVTGTATDRAWTEPLRKLAGENAPGIHWLQERLSGDELFAVLGGARAVVVPSTGTAHVSAALGAPVVGLYSSVLVERAVRWGPLGEKVTIVQPKDENRDRFDCMETIGVEEVLSALESHL